MRANEVLPCSLGQVQTNLFEARTPSVKFTCAEIHNSAASVPLGPTTPRPPLRFHFRGLRLHFRPAPPAIFGGALVHFRPDFYSSDVDNYKVCKSMQEC